MNIRRFRREDLEALHIINEESVPGVGTLTRDRLEALVAASAATLVAVDTHEKPAGFVLVMLESLDYESLNYRWVSKRYDRFAYIDRIAVAEAARRQRIGETLYAAAIEAFAGNRPVLLAEVNLEPPNPGSLRFHKRLGFREIGERWDAVRSKGVVYLERALS
jgi:predicted GNAT superfamily acetyltransferase